MLRVGAIVASTNMRLAETFGAAELVAFDGSSDDVFAEMIDAVRSGLIDAFVDDEPAFGGAVAGGEFRIAHIAETQNPWGAACRKDDGLVRGLIDDGSRHTLHVPIVGLRAASDLLLRAQNVDDPDSSAPCRPGRRFQP